MKERNSYNIDILKYFICIFDNFNILIEIHVCVYSGSIISCRSFVSIIYVPECRHLILTRGPLLPTIIVPPPTFPGADSHEMPVVHCWTLEGFVRGSHLALKPPSADLHSTLRICMPWPQDSEHFWYVSYGVCMRNEKREKCTENVSTSTHIHTHMHT